MKGTDVSKTYLSTADFLAGITLEPVDVEVPGLGTVQVRGLTAVEMATIAERANGNNGELMVLAARYGLLRPALTDDDLPALRGAAAMRFLPIMQRIMQLSGQAAANDAPLAGGGSSPAATEPRT